MNELWVSMVPVPKGNRQEIVRMGRSLRVRPCRRIKAAQRRLASGLRIAAGEWEKIDCPVWRDACYVLPIAKSWPKWKKVAARELRYLPEGRGGAHPDTGNLTKLLDDAIEEAGLVTNDGLIVGGTTCKLYGDQPGYLIRLTPLPQASRKFEAWPFVRPPLVPPTSTWREYKEKAIRESDRLLQETR